MVNAKQGVKRFLRDHPNWLPIIKACADEARENQEFAGKSVLKRAGMWVPGLTALTRAEYAILKHEETTKKGREAYYSMPDLAGVLEALQEIPH